MHEATAMESVEPQVESANVPETATDRAQACVSDFQPSRFKYTETAVLAFLAIVMIAQIWMSLTKLSVTSDEIDHLHAGYRYWQCNDFGWNPEHPPLVKIIAAAPLQLMHINDPAPNACGLPNDKGLDFALGHDFIFANPERMLTAARFAVSSLSVLLLLTVWFFARKLFGVPEAIIAATLIAFEPNILAHGGLVTTDVAAALGFLLAVYAMYLYVIGPGAGRLLVVGLATGFAFCVKYSTILLVVILPALLLADTLFFERQERGKNLLRDFGALLAIAAVSLVVVWASYGFSYAARPFGAAAWTPYGVESSQSKLVTQVVPQLSDWHVLPEGYLLGLQDVLLTAELGRPTFLLGKHYNEGTWLYFPVSTAIKFTVSFLLLILVSVVSLKFWKGKRRELLFLLLPAMVFLGFSINSKLNIGIRHFLPILPFLAIFAAAGVWSLASAHKWRVIALALLLAFHVGSSLHVFPNYLSYANELWGGPAETYRYLADSNVDWGQAQKMARDYIAQHQPANCYFLRAFASLNSDYKIPCAGASQIYLDLLDTPFTGTFILSASVLDGVNLDPLDTAARRVFKDVKPTAKLGGSALMVYEGSFDVRPIVASQLVVQARSVGEQEQNPQLALEKGTKAVELDSGNPDAHIVMCASYDALGERAKGEYECNVALTLVRNNPRYSPRQVKSLENFINRKGLSVSSPSSSQ